MISIVAVAKNEELYINEWIEYHKKLGFDKIVIYDNGGNGELKSNGIVEVFDAPGNAIQLQAYNDYIQSQMSFNDWVLFCDIDEFLVLHGHKTVKDFLKKYKNVDCVRLNWKVYGDCGQIKYENKPVIERFPDPAPEDCLYNDTIQGVRENNHVKNFYRRTFKPAQAGVHNTNVIGGVVVNTDNEHTINGPFQDLHYEGAWINHYICKSTEEWCKRRLNKTDATGNQINNDSLIRWYKNLNVMNKEKEEMINAYACGSYKNMG